jgi:putative chitinase
VAVGHLDSARLFPDGAVVTPEQLRQATGCTREASIAFASPLTVAIRRWNVKRVPEFIGQIAVESARLSRLTENLNYTTPERLMVVWPRRFPTRESALPFVRQPEALANFVYQGRMGNVQPGDGWKFRGRGLKQLTGRNNYQAYQLASDVMVLVEPDKLLDPVFASDSAAWFWSVNGLDGVADDVQETTRRVNGGLNGLTERIALTNIARQVLA